MAVLDSPNISAISSNNLIRGIIDGCFGKGGVEVQHVVAAPVVVAAPAVILAVASVPDIRKPCHRLWLLLIDRFQKSWIHRAAVAAHAVVVKL